MRSFRTFTSPSIIKMIKSRRMRWAGHVAHMGEKRNATGFWWESLKETDRKTYNIGGRTILRWILEREDGAVQTGFIWLRIGVSVELL
jgi:hypothetical protein